MGHDDDGCDVEEESNGEDKKMEYGALVLLEAGTVTARNVAPWCELADPIMMPMTLEDQVEGICQRSDLLRKA